MPKSTRASRSNAGENYPTPLWCVDRLLEAVHLPGGTWLEPCAGHGQIIQAVNCLRDDVAWEVFEIRRECQASLEALVGSGRTHIGDFFTEVRDAGAFDVVLSNTPFTQTTRFVETSLGLASIVVTFQRLDFVGSQRRSRLMTEHPPDVYVIPERVSFSADGANDYSYMAWFVWPPERRDHGQWKRLAATPIEERRANRRTGAHGHG